MVSLTSTLDIFVSLNVCDWIEFMRQNPIKAPAHKDMNWAEFVTSEWARERSGLDHEIVNPSSVECSFGFSHEEVIPCLTLRDTKIPTLSHYMNSGAHHQTQP